MQEGHLEMLLTGAVTMATHCMGPLCLVPVPLGDHPQTIPDLGSCWPSRGDTSWLIWTGFISTPNQQHSNVQHSPDNRPLELFRSTTSPLKRSLPVQILRSPSNARACHALCSFTIFGRISRRFSERKSVDVTINQFRILMLCCNVVVYVCTRGTTPSRNSLRASVWHRLSRSA